LVGKSRVIKPPLLLLTAPGGIIVVSYAIGVSRITEEGLRKIVQRWFGLAIRYLSVPLHARPAKGLNSETLANEMDISHTCIICLQIGKNRRRD
jgi:hypothetical protein